MGHVCDQLKRYHDQGYLVTESTTPDGANWLVLYGDLALISQDGTVHPIYYRQPSVSLTVWQPNAQQTNVGYTINNWAGGDANWYPWGNTTYFHEDHLGSSRLLTSGYTGVPMWQSTFQPYGYEPNPQMTVNNYKFTGFERDAESGLDHAFFRQYAPNMGRWMSPDPAGLAAVDMSNPQTWNRYAYVMGRPTRLVDPLGLDPIKVPGTTIDVFGGSAPFVDLLSSGLGWESQSGGIGLGGSSGPTGSMHSPELTVETDSGGGTGDTSPANNDRPTTAFIKIFFSLQPQIDAWNKGYYKCLAQKTAGGATAPVVTHTIGVAATKAAENNAARIAGAYYHFTDGRFTAWGKYSKVLVPNLAPKIAAAAEALDVAGWAYFDYELAKAIGECSEVLE